MSDEQLGGTVTDGQPFTHNDGTDRRYKMCQCSKCGSVHRCTPSSDFYSTEDNRLQCETCFRASLHAAGIVFVNLGGTNEQA